MEIMPKIMRQMMVGGEDEMDAMCDMSSMMADDSSSKISMMPKMMTTMMPECLKVMLPYVPIEKRTDSAVRMVANLLKTGSKGMFGEIRGNILFHVIIGYVSPFCPVLSSHGASPVTRYSCLAAESTIRPDGFRSIVRWVPGCNG